jgi:centromere protein I
VGKLDTIELPNQLIAVLGDPLLQKLMQLKPNNEARQRVSNWLESYAQDVVSGEVENKALDVFVMIETYVSATKVRLRSTGPTKVG